MEEIINQIIENRNYHMLSDTQVEVIKHLYRDNKVLRGKMRDISVEFLQYDWKNSNAEQITNQLKSLYEAIFRDEEISNNETSND